MERADAASIESRVERLLVRQQTLIGTLINVLGQHTIEITRKDRVGDELMKRNTAFL
jgi:hypothetical protein